VTFDVTGANPSSPPTAVGDLETDIASEGTTLAAAGASGAVGPNLDVRLRTDCATAASKRIRGATLQQCITTAITKPYAYLPTGYRAGIMPPNFGQTLTSTQIQSLASFLASVAK